LPILAGACSDSPPEGIDNIALGISISSIPKPFQLETNEGESLSLTAPNFGRLDFQVGRIEESGINLVTEVKKRKAHFEALPGGTYLGNTELATQIGTAFSARGSYDSDNGRREETWIYTLHPTSDRLLTLTYRYPAAEDSQERVQQLLTILGEVVALAGSSDDTASPGLGKST
jgi:hypothetical protein